VGRTGNGKGAGVDRLPNPPQSVELIEMGHPALFVWVRRTGKGMIPELSAFQLTAISREQATAKEDADSSAAPRNDNKE
jgi:hypothetical protein